jgi:hypothetical protein
VASYESEIPSPGVSKLGLGLPRWDGPTDVLRRALELAQADLDAAGLEAIRISFAVAGGSDDELTVNVQWRGTWTSDSIRLDEDDLSAATADVAGQLAQGLIELEGVYWVTCPTHTMRARAHVNADGEAVWCCAPRGATPHEVGKIGELAASMTHPTRKIPRWRSLKDLPSPR